MAATAFSRKLVLSLSAGSLIFFFFCTLLHFFFLLYIYIYIYIYIYKKGKSGCRTKFLTPLAAAVFCFLLARVAAISSIMLIPMRGGRSPGPLPMLPPPELPPELELLVLSLSGGFTLRNLAPANAPARPVGPGDVTSMEWDLLQ